ncbi:clasp N terminal-domain-containing protein [Pisolithus thermaeus]|nr:clasp N terminal-domain-containing protein [Pisolithus thermaeus]
MTTTWTLRHPWLDSSAFKRRLPGDEGDLDEHYLSSGSPFKRRKCHSLEHGFACMTLNQAASTAFPSVTSAEQHYSTQTVLNDENKPMYLASSVQGVVLPSSIEEPPSPDTDVEMDVEDDLPSDASRLAPTIREESMLEVNEIKIPSTVLEHWKQQVRSSPIIPITSPAMTETSTPNWYGIALNRRAAGGRKNSNIVPVVFDDGTVQGSSLLGQLLSSDLLCCEKSPTGSAGTTHGVLVAGLVEIRLRKIKTKNNDLSLPGESVDLFESRPGYATFEDAEVLFGVDIEWLFVDGGVIWMVFAGGYCAVDVVGGDLVCMDVLEDVVLSQSTVVGDILSVNLVLWLALVLQLLGLVLVVVEVEMQMSIGATCSSPAALRAEFEVIRRKVTLTETEDSWDVITDGLSSLITICHNGGCDHASDMVSGIRSLSRPLNSAMNSERSRLSGTAVDLVSALAVSLGSSFEPLVSLFVPTLLGLCGRTNKVFTSRAKSCILTIIEHTQLPSILHYLADMATQKSALQRLIAAEAVLACLNCLNPPDLEKEVRARLVEDFIKVTARDASPDVRKASKQIFGAYKTLMPARVENFVNPLTPTVKKYLDIQSNSKTNRTVPALKETRPKTTAIKQTESSVQPRPVVAHGVTRTTRAPHMPTRRDPVRPPSVTTQRAQCSRPLVNPGPQRPATKANVGIGCNALSDPPRTGGARRVPLPANTDAGPSKGSFAAEVRKPIRGTRLVAGAPKVTRTAARTGPVQPNLKAPAKGIQSRPKPVPRPLPRSPSPVVRAAAVPLPPSPEPSAAATPPTPVHSSQENDATTTPTVEQQTVSETPVGQPVNPSPSKTPITTLLASIQRGFLFTPASPLSPPHTYQPVANERTRTNQQSDDDEWPALNMTRPLRS